MHSDVTALSKASIWHEASRIVHEEGFRAFWKGNLVTIAHRLPYSSVNFYAYERYKSVCDAGLITLEIEVRLICDLIDSKLSYCPLKFCSCYSQFLVWKSREGVQLQNLWCTL